MNSKVEYITGLLDGHHYGCSRLILDDRRSEKLDELLRSLTSAKVDSNERLDMTVCSSLMLCPRSS